MAINSRIDLLISQLGLNKNSFSNAIGVNPTVIHNIVKGRNAPSYDLLSKIILSFGNINPTWLLTGEGEMLRAPDGGTAARAQRAQAPPPCPLCAEKEKLIAAQQRTIEILERELHHAKALYDDYKEKGHPHDGQKRKAG